jgi:hypothetical protein
MPRPNNTVAGSRKTSRPAVTAGSSRLPPAPAARRARRRRRVESRDHHHHHQQYLDGSGGLSVDLEADRPAASGAPAQACDERRVPDGRRHGCNTKKGAVAPVVEWPKELFVADPASIVTSAERLARKRGSEATGRCPTEADAVTAAEWLVDRLSRLAPSLHVESRIRAGGGQYLVVLTP